MNRLGVALLACALAVAAAVLVARRWAPTPATGEAGGPNDEVPRDVGLSSRPDRSVPDVTGLAAQAALDRLAASELFGDVEYVAAEPGSVDARPGVVLAQAPPAGTVVTRGAVVSLRASRPARPTGTVEVPDLVGRPSVDAARELVARGLSPRVRFVPDGGDPGSVGRQEPGAGVAEAGTIVILFVVRPAR